MSPPFLLSHCTSFFQSPTSQLLCSITSQLGNHLQHVLDLGYRRFPAGARLCCPLYTGHTWYISSTMPSMPITSAAFLPGVRLSSWPVQCLGMIRTAWAPMAAPGTEVATYLPTQIAVCNTGALVNFICSCRQSVSAISQLLILNCLVKSSSLIHNSFLKINGSKHQHFQKCSNEIFKGTAL